MEPHHQENVFWVLLFEVVHRLGAGGIDGWDEETGYAVLDRALDHGVAVLVEFFGVEMGVGVGYDCVWTQFDGFIS
jgi:hypothetical protein